MQFLHSVNNNFYVLTKLFLDPSVVVCFDIMIESIFKVIVK